ncbi:MTNR1A [Branchiostoma lanceolatum]|uniref:MTNR1A protein n=1 Tax=Branchiostoma lanceolatum TaxID=7740 RepID=A0A8J9YRE1_BRALA|nr:MTNR1A [Branchiostoma lanceolatum]
MACNITMCMDMNLSLVQSNSSYDQGKPTWLGFDDDLLKIIYLVLVIFWMLTGCVGNVLVVAAIATHKRLRTLANIFVVNLAIADIVVSSIINVFTIISIMSDGKYWEERPMLCDVIGGMCVIVCVCSMYNIAAISVNRYIAICKNSYYHDIYTRRKTILMAISLWVWCTLLDLPNFIGWGGHHYDRKTMICSYNHLADYSYTLFLILTGLGLPMSVVIFCYICLYLHVQQSRKNLAKLSGKNAIIYMKASKSVQYPPKSPLMNKSTRMDKTIKVSEQKKKGWGRMTNSDFRLLKTLLVIFVIFAFCWTPYGVIFLVDSKGQWPKPVYVMAIILAHLNSSMNSVIYGVMNRSFRQAYIALFRRCFCGRRYNENYFGDKTTQVFNNVNSNGHYHSNNHINDIQMIQLGPHNTGKDRDSTGSDKSRNVRL